MDGSRQRDLRRKAKCGPIPPGHPRPGPFLAAIAALRHFTAGVPSMRRTKIALAGLLGTACIALGATAALTETAANHTQYGTWGVELSGMDKSVKPGDNFFMFVNGTWYKSAVIPPDRASTGSFQNLRILSETRMNEIAASLDAKPYDQLTDDEKKLRDLYDAFLDQKQIDAKGLAPAKKDLGYIADLKTL